MKNVARLISTALFLTMTQMASAQVTVLPGQISCQFNCAQFQLVGSTLVATLLDRTGVPFKVVAHELGENAKPANIGIGNLRNGQVQAMDTSQNTTTVYETTTHTVYVTTTIIYNNLGQIVDIKISEIRVPRGRQER